MAFVNKTKVDLKNAISSFLNRTDPEVLGNLDLFISLAEQEFARSVKIPMDEGQLIYPAVGGGSLSEGVPIPEDMLSPIGVSVATLPDGSSSAVINSYVRVDGFAFFEIFNAGTDEGHYFAKYENSFLFYPELKNGDLVSIAYHKDLIPLNSDSDTSAALKYGFDLMLYWSLKHASVYLRDPEQEQYWDGKAQEAAATMGRTFDEMHWGGSPLRVLGV